MVLNNDYCCVSLLREHSAAIFIVNVIILIIIIIIIISIIVVDNVFIINIFIVLSLLQSLFVIIVSKSLSLEFKW